MFFHQCTIRPFVPVWLIVFGGLVLSLTIVHLIKTLIFRKTGQSENNSNRTNVRRNSCEAVSVVFLVFWFVIGSYYAVHTYRQWSGSGRVSCSDDGYHNDCCNPVMVYFTLTVIMTIFGVTVSTIIIGCSCFTLLKCMSLLSGHSSATVNPNDD